MKPISISWVYRNSDPQLRAEIASGVHDERYPSLRVSYLHYMSEEFLRGAVSELPTSGTIN